MWNALLLIAMVLASLQLIFLYLIRPLLIQKLRYIVFAQRDNLRLLALAGQIPQTDSAYAILESRLNVCVQAMGTIDIADLFMFRPTQAQKLEAIQSLDIINASIPQIRSAYGNAMMCISAAIILNSPVIFVILPIVLFAAVFLSRIRACVDYYKTKAWAVSATPGLCTT